jgi:hypothetical protein
MDIREFRYYQFLAEKGHVKPVTCMIDSEHGNALAKLDKEDNVIVYCLACDFKLIPGIAFFDTIRKKIHEVSKDLIDDKE